MKPPHTTIGITETFALALTLTAGCTMMNNGGAALVAPLADPPKPWHVEVKRFSGPDRDIAAREIAEAFKTVEGIDPDKVHIYTDGDQKLIGYNRYASLEDDQARKDLVYIKNILVPNLGRPFWDARLAPLPEPDPPIPAEWELVNSDGYWTLEIARFDGVGRKKAAVEYVKELRRQNVPAYVQHLLAISRVTVGSFPKNAVSSGRRRSLSMVPVARDPELKRWIKRFPQLAINAHVVRYKSLDGEQGTGRLASRIMRVPKPGQSLWGSEDQ